MRLSFLPGNLHLSKIPDGNYVITIQGKEVFTTRDEKKAITRFNTLRKDLESQSPAHEVTHEERKAILQRTNLCVIVMAVHELSIEPMFWQEDFSGETVNGPNSPR